MTSAAQRAKEIAERLDEMLPCQDEQHRDFIACFECTVAELEPEIQARMEAEESEAMIAAGVKHWHRCPNYVAGGGDLDPCVRCERDSWQARAERAEAAYDALRDAARESR